MAYRIAVATSDGKRIDSHFGEAEGWAIYEIDSGAVRFVERRRTEALSRSADGHGRALAATLEALKDCPIVAAAAVGGSVRRELDAEGKLVVMAEGEVEGLLAKAAASRFASRFTERE
jgi:predicted Fe-Mo cluster-binding NifX family protein